MNQEERLDVLLKWFCEESPDYRDLRAGRENRRKVLRSLMNVRMPGPVPEEVLKVQDAFLQEEAREKGIVRLKELPSAREEYGACRDLADRISVWQGDITRLQVDAIVNAANCRLLGCFVPCHHCIDNAIHSASGVELREACAALMKAQGHEEPPGKAKMTSAFNLPCSYVIHTVGPVVRGPLREEDCCLLEECYRSCLSVAKRHRLGSLAFCCISTGEFHFPNEKAAEIAVRITEEFLRTSPWPQRVIFNVFKNEDLELYKNRMMQYSR